MLLEHNNRSVEVKSFDYQNYEFQFDSRLFYGIYSKLNVITTDEALFEATVQMSFLKTSDHETNFDIVHLYTFESIFDEIATFKNPRKIIISNDIIGFKEYRINTKLIVTNNDSINISS